MLAGGNLSHKDLIIQKHLLKEIGLDYRLATIAFGLRQMDTCKRMRILERADIERSRLIDICRIAFTSQSPEEP